MSELVKEYKDQLVTAENQSDELSPLEQRKVLRKVDIAILPWAAWLYLLNYLDRTNMGAVKIANADSVPPRDVLTELKLNDGQWQLAISIFFVGYVIFELPSNIILTRVGPSKWMSRIIVSWGICAMCLAFCSNYAGILACRLFLGIAEAGFFPGMMLYFSFWYTQREYAVRASLFYSSANLAGAFGGLLAYGITFMNGVNGWSGWRWIFLLEGIPSIICGLLTWFILPDYPLTAEFLTPDERTFLIRRLPPSASPTDEHYHLKTVLAVLLDPHAHIMNCLYLAWAIAAYALTFWLPTIVRNLGFSSTQALLMTTPPWVVAWFFALGVTWNSDRMQERIWHIVAVNTIFFIGLVIFATVPTGGSGTAVLYFACFLACCGASSFMPLMWAWRTKTAESSGAAGTAIAGGLMGSFGNIGGAISTFLFRSDWAPRYIPSFAICCALCATATVLVLVEHAWRTKEAARNAQEPVWEESIHERRPHE